MRPRPDLRLESAGWSQQPPPRGPRAAPAADGSDPAGDAGASPGWWPPPLAWLLVSFFYATCPTCPGRRPSCSPGSAVAGGLPGAQHPAPGCERKPGRGAGRPAGGRPLRGARQGVVAGRLDLRRVLRRPGRLLIFERTERGPRTTCRPRSAAWSRRSSWSSPRCWLERACRVPKRRDDDENDADDRLPRSEPGLDSRVHRGDVRTSAAPGTVRATGSERPFDLMGAPDMRYDEATLPSASTDDRATDAADYRDDGHPPGDFAHRRPAGQPTRATPGRRPSSRPPSLDDVFDDPAHGEPGRDRMAVHIVWEIVLLLGVAAIGYLLLPRRLRRLRAAAPSTTCWSPAPRSACSPSAPG